MIQINPLQRYIDGGARAAITTPPSASLVFDLPGRAIWVKGVKLKGTDHTYTFSHDNYISLTNTPGSNESEDILIGINTTLLKQAIDTTYGIVNATTNGLAPMFSSANKATAAAATTYNFLGIAGTTLKWYSLPWRNVRINAETSDKLGVNDTSPLIISQGTGISVTWDSSGKKIVITNTAPDQNHNTDSNVAQTRTVQNKNYPLILKGSADDTGIIAGVNFNESITYNPSTQRLLINSSKVITMADVYVGATASAAATSGLVPAATSAQRTYFLRGDGTWATPQDYNTWRPIKVNSSEKLGSGTNTGAVDFVAGTGITLGWDATNKKITITNSAPDQNHNTDRTGIKLGNVSGNKKTDGTVILANSTSGLIIAGGTNKFSIGDGTNYIEVPITISHGLSTKNITINGTAYAIYTSASSLPTFVAPGSYAGTGGYILATNSAKNGLEWVAKPTSNVTTSAVIASSASGTTQITAAQANPFYNLLEGGVVSRSILFVSGTGITISAAADGKITITNSAPDVNHNTHYTTSMYIGENNNTKANKVVTSPYLKLFDDNTRRSTLRFISGTGISVASDANGNITITNSSPDANHNVTTSAVVTTSATGTTQITSAQTNPYYNLLEGGLVARSIRFVAGNGITISAATDGLITITNSKPDVNHDTHYVTSMYIGESNDTKSNVVATNPYLKLFDNNTRRSTLRFVAGNGITIGSDASGNITITNSKPDVNHNSHYTTTMFAGANNDTKANAVATNPYLKLFDNDARRSTLRFVAGTGITIASDANGNITVTNSAPDVNHDTHYTTHLYIGALNATSSSKQANPWITLCDNTTVRNSYQLKGDGASVQVNSDASGNVTTSLNVIYCRDDSSPSSKGLWKTIKNGKTSTTNSVRFYTIYASDGGPTNHGEMLEILSYNANHWQPQLWFGAGKGGHMYYRNKDYNNDTWGDWLTIADSGNVVNKAATIGTSSTTIATIAGVNITAKIGSYAASNHTHPLSIAADSGKSSITLAASTKYKLTAGGSTYVFTSTPDENVKQSNNDNNQNSPILLKNGTGTGNITSGTIFADGVTVNPSTNSLTVAGNIIAAKFHSNASATDRDLTRIPSDTEIALETGNGNGAVSAWIWRENYAPSNWGIFHNNSTDEIDFVGNNNIIVSIGLGGESGQYLRYKGTQVSLEGHTHSWSDISGIITNTKLPARLTAYGQDTSDHRNVDTTCFENGFYWVNAGTLPTNVGDADIITVNANSSYGHQLAFKFSGNGTTGSSYDGKDLYTRIYKNGTWLEWYTILTSGNWMNFITTSTFAAAGHDHDSRYLRKDTNDSTAYQYSFTKTNDHAIQVGTIRGRNVSSQSGEYIHLYERVHIGSPSGWGSRNAPSYGLSTYGGAWLATDTGSVGIATTSPETKLDVNGILQIYQRGLDNTAFKNLLLLKALNSNETGGDNWSDTYPTFGIGFRRYWTSGSSPYGETTCAGIYATVSGSWRGGLVFRTKNNLTQGGTHDVTALRLAPSGAASFATSVTAGGTIKSTYYGPAFAAHVTSGSWAYMSYKAGSSEWHIGLNDSASSYIGQGSAFEIRSLGASYSGISVRYNTSSYGKLVVSVPSGECSIGYYSSGAVRWTVGCSDGTNFGWYQGSGGGWKMTLNTSGDLTARHFYESSDIRLKHDISMLSKSIRKFRFNNDNKLYYGFIAQELETLHPELVDSSGEYKTVNYNSAICYYIAELENKVQKLEERIRKFESSLA